MKAKRCIRWNLLFSIFHFLIFGFLKLGIFCRLLAIFSFDALRRFVGFGCGVVGVSFVANFDIFAGIISVDFALELEGAAGALRVVVTWLAGAEALRLARRLLVDGTFNVGARFDADVTAETFIAERVDTRRQ